MNLDSRYALQPGTKFRYEEFGGIVYRRRDDRLHFLTSRLAITLISLAGTGTVREIAGKLGASSANKQAVEERILKILSQLEELKIIHELEH